MDGASTTQPTPLGTAFSVLALTAIVAGLLLFSGPILSAGLLALLFHRICRRIASRHLDSVTLLRSLPRRSLAGESFPIEVRLCAGSRFPTGAAIRFLDPLAGVRHERILPPSQARECHLRYTGKAMRRGFHTSRNWTLRSTWPIGLFASEKRGAFRDNGTLLLLPKPLLPAGLRARLNRVAFESDERSLAMPDPSAEFRLLREFRSGDPVRSIHWPGSLRTGQLQVAELEPPRPKPGIYGILIHSYNPPGRVLTPETFEQILRIATGLTARFKKEEIPLIFRHFPESAARLSNGNSFRDQFDRLALCRRMPVASLEELTGAAPDFETCDEVFVLSDCPLSDWEASLRRSFPRCTCIDISRFTDAARPGLRTRKRLPE